MNTLNVAQASKRFGDDVMRLTVEQDKVLLRQDRVTTLWAAQLEGRRLAEEIAVPDYGDPHPTPGSAKVPEIIKGFFLRSRI